MAVTIMATRTMLPAILSAVVRVIALAPFRERCCAGIIAHQMLSRNWVFQQSLLTDLSGAIMAQILFCLFERNIDACLILQATLGEKKG